MATRAVVVETTAKSIIAILTANDMQPEDFIVWYLWDQVYKRHEAGILFRETQRDNQNMSEQIAAMLKDAAPSSTPLPPDGAPLE